MKDILNMTETELNIECARFMGLDVKGLAVNEPYYVIYDKKICLFILVYPNTLNHLI